MVISNPQLVGGTQIRDVFRVDYVFVIVWGALALRPRSRICWDVCLLARVSGRLSFRLDPGLLGVSVVLRGIPDFTHVPPSSRLQGPDGVTLTVDMENLPCNLPAREIEKDEPGHGKAFKRAAEGRRGVTAWVERPGTLRPGDRLALWLPAQRGWNG